MTINGTSLQDPPPQCGVEKLNDPTSLDYNETRKQFSAEPSQQNFGWENCYRKGLDGEVSGVSVEWKGAGTWYPQKVCFDWDKKKNVVSYCEFPAEATQNGLNNTSPVVKLKCATWKKPTRQVLRRFKDCPENQADLPAIP